MKNVLRLALLLLLTVLIVPGTPSAQVNEAGNGLSELPKGTDHYKLCPNGCPVEAGPLVFMPTNTGPGAYIPLQLTYSKEHVEFDVKVAGKIRAYRFRTPASVEPDSVTFSPGSRLQAFTASGYVVRISVTGGGAPITRSFRVLPSSVVTVERR